MIVEKIFAKDEMKTGTVRTHWTPAQLLQQEGIFFLKDVAGILELKSHQIKLASRELQKHGQCPYKVMGVRKVWSHWIVRMSVFRDYYPKHLAPIVLTISKDWNANNLPEVSPADDLIALYLQTGFTHGGTGVGHMIAYDAAFMDTFGLLDGWTMKFVVDSLDVIDEADETNNVLVVDADPTRYDDPWLPRGRPPLPDPQDGTFSSQEMTIDRSTAVTQVLATSFLPTAAEGLYDVAFKLENRNKDALALTNLNIFAAYDFGLKGKTALVFSSALVGDATGARAIPSAIPAQGETGVTTYRLRVPRAFREGQYKLVFVANAHVKTSAEGATLLNMSEPGTRILGTIEPVRLLP